MNEKTGRYSGWVFGTVPDTDPQRKGKEIWRVKVMTPGDHQDQIVKIDRDNVPPGIRRGMNLQFDLTTIGTKRSLIAINTTFDASTT